MASTYSSLKIELIGNGEQPGTWGTTTNTNLGTAIEEAITGSENVAFSSADVTLTLTNTNATQAARNLRLNLTGTSGGARNLIVPTIKKVYVINNGLADAVTVKTSAGTGIVVPAGKTMYVFTDGTNVVDAVTHLSSLTLGAALPVASGGTGGTTLDGAGIVTKTDTQTLTNKTLTDPAIIGTVLEDVFTITDGAAFEIDPSNGSIQLITLGASRTPKATNFAAGESITLMVDDGTAYTLTWTDATFGGSGVIWETNGGVAPTLATSGYTVIVLWKVSTQVYGARVGDA